MLEVNWICGTWDIDSLPKPITEAKSYFSDVMRDNIYQSPWSEQIIFMYAHGSWEVIL